MNAGEGFARNSVQLGGRVVEEARGRRTETGPSEESTESVKSNVGKVFVESLFKVWGNTGSSGSL